MFSGTAVPATLAPMLGYIPQKCDLWSCGVVLFAAASRLHEGAAGGSLRSSTEPSRFLDARETGLSTLITPEEVTRVV